jgi:hypothetical protein
MLVTKTSPVGIDARLQTLQTELHDRLLTRWKIGDGDYKAYGRCYKKPSDNGYIAVNYEGGNEYKEVYADDSLRALSFFGQSAKVGFEQWEKTEVHLVFFVNLATLKPTIEHRADEEVRKDVITLFSPSLYGFEYQGFELYLENVLREYPGSRRDNRLSIVDLHPMHCFRINLKFRYDINSNNCTPFTNF